MTYKVGIIGTGPPVRTVERGGGFGVARTHCEAWNKIEQASVVAACDLKAENLEAFCADFGIGQGFQDYREMLEKADLDFVSICTWPVLHCEMVVAAAESGVRGIYCEKPMCVSLEEADRMIAACKSNGAVLSISHQRRFEPMYLTSKSWIDEGKLGKITEMSSRISVADADLLSWGTHWFDLFGFFQNDAQPKSVLAQIDCSEGLYRYGHPVENHSVVQVVYENGVTCMMEGGNCLSSPYFRVIGDKGCLTISGDLCGWLSDGTQMLRVDVKRNTADFLNSFIAAMTDLIGAVEQRRLVQLDASLARVTTEMIMAAYESANQRRRIDLPLNKRTLPLLDRSEFEGKV